MHFVPEAFIGLIQVFLCGDGRYGAHDPIQWPQLHAPGFEYLCCVRRRMVHESMYSAIWQTPDEMVDFETVEGSAFRNLGLISRTWARDLDRLVEDLLREAHEYQRSRSAVPHEDLHTLCTNLCQARDRLLHYTATFRDLCLQLRATQRFWLLSRAFLDYSRAISSRPDPTRPAVNNRFMGAFTTDPQIVQTLLAAGIPVWHIRPDASILDETNIGAVVLPTKPTDIITEHWSSQNAPLYSGLVGAAHLRVVSRPMTMYTDFSSAPMLVRYDRETYAARAPTESSIPGPTRPPKPNRSAHHGK